MDNNKNMKIVELQQPKVKKIQEDTVATVTQQFLGFDKTILMLLVVVGLSLAISYLLFRELKKTKEEIRNIKNNEIDYDDITEKVENNSNSVKAMEIKIDQIIGVLQNQHTKQQVPQQVPQQVHQQQKSEKKQLEHVQKVVKKIVEDEDEDSDGFEDSDDEKVVPTIGGGLKAPVEIRI